MSRSGVGLKYKGTGRLSMPWPSAVCFASALMLIMPMLVDLARAAVPGGMDIEIPLSELKNVKKGAPPKKAAGKPKTKNKSEAPSQGAIADEAVSPKLPDQTKSPANETRSVAAGEKAPSNPPATPAPAPENTKISHEPYSFVVANKSTVIHAVIYREADELKSVTCRIRVAKKGAPTTVKMKRLDDSRFTYTATLPGLPLEMSSLSYAIIVVDSSGKESISQEFVTPVKSSPLVPSWQN